MKVATVMYAWGFVIDKVCTQPFSIHLLTLPHPLIVSRLIITYSQTQISSFWY